MAVKVTKNKTRFTLVRGNNWISNTHRFTHGTYHDIDDPVMIEALRKSVDSKGRRRFAEGEMASAKKAGPLEKEKPRAMTEDDLREDLIKMDVVFPADADWDELKVIHNQAIAEKGSVDPSGEEAL